MNITFSEISNFIMKLDFFTLDLNILRIFALVEAQLMVFTGQIQSLLCWENWGHGNGADHFLLSQGQL